MTNDFISDEIYFELLVSMQQATVYNYKKYAYDFFMKFLVISNTKFSKHKNNKPESQEESEMKIKIE